MQTAAIVWAVLGIAALIAGLALAVYASSTDSRRAGLADLGVFYGVIIAAAGALIIGLRVALVIRGLAAAAERRRMLARRHRADQRATLQSRQPVRNGS